ncbi:MAG: hypothetical protein HY960_09925 [Ignavibacteriae bacterium]|nr:hypothetical protein [Ignavibacteriota bacterium]
MTQTLIELSDEQMKIIEEMATKRHLTIIEFIKEKLGQFLLNETRKPDVQQKQRALSVAGRFKSGLHDLSTRHDDYLAESLRL